MRKLIPVLFTLAAVLPVHSFATPAFAVNEKTERSEKVQDSGRQGRQFAQVGERMVTSVLRRAARLDKIRAKIAAKPGLSADATAKLATAKTAIAAAKTIANEALALFRSAASSTTPKEAYKQGHAKLNAARAQLEIARKNLVAAHRDGKAANNEPPSER